MKVNFLQFNPHLLSPYKPIYCVSGDEHVQRQEIEDSMIQYFEQHNFTSIRKQISATFSCKHVIGELKCLNLFEPQRFFIAHCPNIQWIKAAEQDIKQFITTWNRQTVLLVTVAKLEKAQQQSSWLKLFEQHGLHIQLWPLNESQFSSWLKKKAAAANLDLSREALEQLLQHVDGNLNSALQEIYKLKLQFGTQHISVENIIQSVALSQKYNAFKVVEYGLLGHPAKVVQQLVSLKNDGIEPMLMLGALTYELRQLLNFAHDASLASKQQRNEKYRIALNRQPDTNFWWCLLTQAHTIDQQIKSNSTQPILIWDDMIKICLNISGATPL